MENQTRTTVRIHGKDYHMKGEGPEEYIHRVAICVDKKIEKVIQKNPNLNITMAGVLTAINIADELLKLNDKYNDINEKSKLYQEEIKEYRKQIKELQGKLMKYTIEYSKFRKDKSDYTGTQLVDLTKNR